MHVIRAFNRRFMRLYIQLALLGDELGLAEKSRPSLLGMRASQLFNSFLLLWSGAILLTCGLKFFRAPSFAAPPAAADTDAHRSLKRLLEATGTRESSASASASGGSSKWASVLRLDYLPQIGAFAALYNGYVLAVFVPAVCWRVYLTFFRRPKLRRPKADLPARADFERRPPKRPATATATAATAPFHHPELEVVAFFLEGPQSSRDAQQSASELIEGHFRRHFSHFKPEETLMRDLLGPGCSLLTLAHLKQGPLEGLAQTYGNPVRRLDCLLDKSAARWRFLARRVWAFVSYAGLISMPVFYLSVTGLNQINALFGPPPPPPPPPDEAALRSAAGPGPLESGAHDEEFQAGGESAALVSWRQLNAWLRVYGVLEQLFTHYQLFLFYTVTNIVLTLFYADLTHKSATIRRELERLLVALRGELTGSLPTRSQNEIQLKLWAYFDALHQFDGLVSRYSLVSVAQLALGLGLSLSFFRLSDDKLKAATVSHITCDLLSFTYLHLLSHRIKTSNGPLGKAIFSIAAREREPMKRREWHRPLNSFFANFETTTFTTLGRYPNDFCTWIKSITAILASCTLLHRVFHRGQWNQMFTGEPGPQTFPAEAPPRVRRALMEFERANLDSGGGPLGLIRFAGSALGLLNLATLGQ